MIIFGTRGQIIDLGSIGVNKCMHCNNEAEIHVFLSFRYFHIFWIPMFLTTRSYQTACSICSYGYEVDNSKVDEIYKNSGSGSPIPWIYKFGWIIPVSIIALIIIISVAAS